jgi:hypothetical protein
MKKRFEDLNAEVKRDCEALVVDKDSFFSVFLPLVRDSTYFTYGKKVVVNYHKYYYSCLNTVNTQSDLLSQVNIQKLRNYEQVITPMSKSALLSESQRQYASGGEK